MLMFAYNKHRALEYSCFNYCSDSAKQCFAISNAKSRKNVSVTLLKIVQAQKLEWVQFNF